jgi:predicted RNA-binding protein
MKTETKTLILWGFHPAHDNVPMRLEKYSRKAQERRQREGWTCAAYAEGDEPVGLALQAAKVGR